MFSALSPSGIRVGASAITTRGMKEAEVEVICDFLDRIVKICVRIQEKCGKNLKDFLKALESDEDLQTVRKDVEVFVIK